jgi:hypothetical protein
MTAACGGDDGGSSSSGGGPSAIVSDFGLAFSPIYTAFDGEHDFRVPIVSVGDVVVDTWEIVDQNGKVVKDVADVTKDSGGGVTLKTRKAGDYIVLAHAGKQTGCAELRITAGTPDQWKTGEQRYNNSIMLTSLLPMGMMAPTLPKDISCKNCHGTGAMFLAVEHTPQQTGGYSDTDLANILTMGVKPNPPDAAASGKCQPYVWSSMSKTGVPLQLYKYFHTWQATPEETTGLVLYLRSLAPTAQGALDFGGLRAGAMGGTQGGAAGAAP